MPSQSHTPFTVHSPHPSSYDCFFLTAASPRGQTVEAPLTSEALLPVCYCSRPSDGLSSPPKRSSSCGPTSTRCTDQHITAASCPSSRCGGSISSSLPPPLSILLSVTAAIAAFFSPPLRSHHPLVGTAALLLLRFVDSESDVLLSSEAEAGAAASLYPLLRKSISDWWFLILVLHMRGAITLPMCAFMSIPGMIRLPSSLCRRTKPTWIFSASANLKTLSSSYDGKKMKDKVVVISGPTGSGKSRLALELAKKLNGEIISADSVQVYQGLDVGSAKPSISDQNEVPHHLIDILHPSQEYSAGQFFEDARKATKDIIGRGRVPIVVGGTGLYLRWYIYGKPNVPIASGDVSSEVSSELEQFQKNGQWEAAVDLVVNAGDIKARDVAQNDWYRLQRSLEIIRSSGLPPSAFKVPYNDFRGLSYSKQSEQAIGADTCTDDRINELSKDLEYEFLCYFLSSPREGLYRSIDLRCEEMLVGHPGILSEASLLLDSGLLPNTSSATRAIGYRQAMEYLLHCREVGGRCSPGDFFAFCYEFQKASRNFAKRQMTWFRNERIYQWLDASKPLEKVISFIHYAYNDQSGELTVPEFLSMRKEKTGRRESLELKAYRSNNKLLIKENDCLPILDWIRRTQSQPLVV